MTPPVRSLMGNDESISGLSSKYSMKSCWKTQIIHPTDFGMTFLVVALLLLLKTPDSLTNPQFWAEDGAVFFQQQFGHGLPQLFNVYNGYLHIIPRAVAWIATFFSYQDSPLVYNLAALCIDTAAITYFSFKSRILAPAWITVMAFMLMPSNNVIFGNLTNVQWFLQFALFAAVLYPARQKKMREDALPVIVVLAIALTGPFSIFCALITFGIGLTLLVIRLSKTTLPIRQTLNHWWTSINKRYLAATVIGAAVQLFFLVLTPRGQFASGPFSPEVAKCLFFKGLQFHTFGAVFLPDILFAGVAAVLLVYATFCLWHCPSISLLLMLAIFIFASLQLLGVSHNASLNTLVSPSAFAGDRYYFFAKTGFWVCLTSSLNKLSRSKYYRQLFLLAPACLVFVSMLNLHHLRRSPLPDLHWKQASEVINSGKRDVVIPINPAPWVIRLTLPEGSTR